MLKTMRSDTVLRMIKRDEIAHNYKDFISGLKYFYGFDIDTIIYLKAARAEKIEQADRMTDRYYSRKKR